MKRNDTTIYRIWMFSLMMVEHRRPDNIETFCNISTKYTNNECWPHSTRFTALFQSLYGKAHILISNIYRTEASEIIKSYLLLLMGNSQSFDGRWNEIIISNSTEWHSDISPMWFSLRITYGWILRMGLTNKLRWWWIRRSWY